MVHALRLLARGMAWAAGAALIATAFLVATEVILRKVFLVSLNVGTEISSYTLAIVASWGFAFALFERNHVRIDALTRYFPRRFTAKFDLLALLGLLGFALALAWFAYGTFAESWQMSSLAMTPLTTPMWIPQGIWVLGLVVFCVACLTLLLKAGWFVFRNRDDEATALIGSPTVENEALAEAAHALAAEKEKQQ